MRPHNGRMRGNSPSSFFRRAIALAVLLGALAVIIFVGIGGGQGFHKPRCCQHGVGVQP